MLIKRIRKILNMMNRKRQKVSLQKCLKELRIKEAIQFFRKMEQLWKGLLKYLLMNRKAMKLIEKLINQNYNQMIKVKLLTNLEKEVLQFARNFFKRNKKNKKKKLQSNMKDSVSFSLIYVSHGVNIKILKLISFS